MTVQINLDINPVSESGKQELRAVANALLAMAGGPTVTIGQNGDIAIKGLSGGGGGGFVKPVEPTITIGEIAAGGGNKPAHLHADNFNAVELANDPAQLTPVAGDVNPATVGFGLPPQPANDTPDPAKLGFGSAAPTPVVPAPPAPPAVPAPPVNNAPPAPPAPAAATGSGVDRDKRGVVWDARVHAGNKATNQDGSWKAKRGADKDLLKQVESQSLAGAQQQQQQTAAMSPVVEFMSKIGNIIVSDANPQGLLTTEQISEILRTEVGVENTIALMGRPDLVPYATQAISNRIGRPL